MPQELEIGLLKIKTDGYNNLDTNSVKKKICDCLEKTELDILIAPEYSFSSEKPYAKGEFEHELKELAKRTKGKKTLLLPGTFIWCDENNNLYNTLPILYDGEVLLNYDKKYDGGEGCIAMKFGKRYANGKTRGVLAWKNLKIGVEICADHKWGTLEGEEKKRDLDLQLIVSAGMYIHDDNLVLKNGGCALLCDGKNLEVEVKEQKRHKTEDIRPSRVENHELYIYSLSIPEGNHN